jgi:hypothetical protein
MRPIWMFFAFLVAQAATSALASREIPRVRVCFVDQPTTAHFQGEVTLTSTESWMMDYAVRVVRGQPLRVELQPVRQGGQLNSSEGSLATLMWPDGRKEDKSAPNIFDGVMKQDGELVVRVAAAHKNPQPFQLTFTSDTPVACNPGERIERFVGRDPDELWKAEPELQARLRKLLGKKYRQYVKRNETIGAIEKHGDTIVIDGCANHMCGVDAATVFISVPDGKLHVLLLFESHRIETFSEDPQHLPSGLVAAQALPDK